jgi:hypothetical protein
MLGSLHTSDVRRFVPRLIFLDRRVQVGKSKLQLFKLDWDSVDQYKADQYAQWKQEYWEKTNTGESARPGTLPPEYDAKIKNLLFALPNSYRREIEHLARLFMSEMTRSRGFDTCVRERCLQPAIAAINTAFYLLDDCLYNEETEGWYRSQFKRLYLHAMQYKFWRGYTGRGLVYDHAGLDKLDESLQELGIEMDVDAIDSGEEDSGDREQHNLYAAFLDSIRRWQDEQETFWAHAILEIDEGGVVSEVDTTG